MSMFEFHIMCGVLNAGLLIKSFTEEILEDVEIKESKVIQCFSFLYFNVIIIFTGIFGLGITLASFKDDLMVEEEKPKKTNHLMIHIQPSSPSTSFVRSSTELPITIMLDASAMKGASCDFRLHLDVVEGFKPPINSNDIEFGTAFHKFRAHWREHGDAQFGEALVIAKNHFSGARCTIKSNKTYLTEVFLWQACIGYKARYTNDNFKPILVPASRNETGKDTLMIEPSTRFSFPIYVDDEVEVIIAGTIDELGKFDNGVNAICDCKTSGVWNVKEYLEQYELDSQLKFYRWALGKYAQMFPDSYIAELVNQEIGCFIDGVFYAGKDKPIQFERSRVYMYKPFELEEIDHLVNKQVALLVENTKAWIKTGIKPRRNGLLNASCKTVYGECKYGNVCKAQDQTTQDLMLERFYKKEFYNPLNHGK